MKKYAIVKQKHLYTNQKNIMYKGKVEYSIENSCITIRYKEYDTNAKVSIMARADDICIHREADVTTHLQFVMNETTTNVIYTEFGNMEIEIFTHKYIKKENIIAVEYDVRQGSEVLDGYRIIWELKEDVS